MFVRSRASRTRAERPIPGDRVLDALDRALIGAHGAALDLVAAYLSRAGTLEADESHAWNPRLEQLAKICRHVRDVPASAERDGRFSPLRLADNGRAIVPRTQHGLPDTAIMRLSFGIR
jgi:hypothetical protein